MVICAAVTAIGVSAQSADERKAWNQPVEPFKIVGNVHYVGAAGVSAFLITTPAGTIVLDGGLPETAPQIAANISTLGFRITDVRVLLNSHAHFDHSGGLAELKRLSGATVVASAGDAAMLRAGHAGSPAVAIDRVVADGDTVELGGTTLTANVTAGHTKGCTTWTTTTVEEGKRYDVVFHCSTSVVDRLVDNREYPQIVADYEASFRKLRAMKADVFLAPHPDFFNLQEKRRRMRPGAANPFVEPGEFSRFVERSERQFRAQLAKESSLKSGDRRHPQGPCIVGGQSYWLDSLPYSSSGLCSATWTSC
jgi:metallo-beta-lactamase class B